MSDVLDIIYTCVICLVDHDAFLVFKSFEYVAEITSEGRSHMI